MAASQRVRSRVPAPHRSILPSVPGVPAGAAVLIAVACTVLGFVIDASGEGEDLTLTFATLYILGCVLAVLAVRYRGLFTTMVLPPLLLLFAVPLAYMQLTGRTSLAPKDILLNLAIPLVHRFPWMAIATVLVGLIGAVRILLHRRGDSAERAKQTRRRDSWGRTAPKRARAGRADADTASEQPPRRRPRPSTPELDDPPTEQHLPRMNRRPAAQVADAPPRVAKGGYPREGRSRAARPAAASPRTEGDQPRGTATRARGGEMPPHPRPNVRYRDRDSSRTQRRDVDDY
ncbi:DUF6542 domain-containing protein [Nocardia sp. NPDC052566]|uniref:DUF6542 domain-containing protein n=1 Tax=Nocardia sp. NPDC052566 TaxID=3364330 RepID=UPI0037C538C0